MVDTSVVNPRWLLADLVGEEIRRRYASRALAIGVYGSLAHRDDTDGSGVDVLVLFDSADDVLAPRTRRVSNVIVSVHPTDPATYLTEVRTLTPAWPLMADRFLMTKPLFDPDGWFERVRDEHLARLAEASSREFATLAREAWCRGALAHARAARLAGWYETEAALIALSEARVAAAVVKGLLTRTYFRNVADAVRRTGVSTADISELGTLLAVQADELAQRGYPVDVEIADLIAPDSD